LDLVKLASPLQASREELTGLNEALPLLENDEKQDMVWWYLDRGQEHCFSLAEQILMEQLVTREG